MSIKQLEHIRNYIDSFPLEVEDDLIIKRGKIKSTEGEEKDYYIISGDNPILSHIINKEWSTFEYSQFEIINNLNLSKEEEKEILETLKFEDSHWDWLKKSLVCNSKNHEWYYFMVDDIPQGACLLFYPKKSYLESGEIFYIEFIAVAPWNRDTKMYSKKFKGVGTELIKIAIINSEKCSLKNGFSLHSLPQSYKYYIKLGMENIPTYDKGTLKYYEMTEEKAIVLKEIK